MTYTCFRCGNYPSHCMKHEWYTFDCWDCKQILQAQSDRMRYD